MSIRGITYDTGFINAGVATLRDLDPRAAAFDMKAIRDQLSCTAVRPTGADLDRLDVAAAAATAAGLAVWYSPFTCDLTPAQMTEILHDGAERAERLRRTGADVTLVCGAELTFVNQGFLPGHRIEDRVPLLPRIHSTHTATGQTSVGPSEDAREPDFARASAALNDFFADVIPGVRDRFNGPISYASTWSEQVDWRPFDIVGIDAYRSAEDRANFEPLLRRLRQAGKRLAVTEFGSGCYTGSAAKGALSEDIVVWEGVTPVRLSAVVDRDEGEQASALTDLVNVFRTVGVDAMFVHTFGFWHMAHRDDPLTDLDRAGYGLVRFRGNDIDCVIDQRWEPKAAFHTISRLYADGEPLGGDR